MCLFQIINNSMHNYFSERMEPDMIYYLLALQSVEGIGCRGARKLIDHFGSAKAALEAGEKLLLEVGGIGPKLVQNLKSGEIYRKADLEMETIEKYRLKVTSFFDREYPEHLRHCEDAPVLLFYKGKMDLAKRHIISIVGTRKMTSYGATFTKRLFTELEKYDPVIISGLAYGVDILAHRLALEYELETIGVLAHGLDRVYPRAHYKTALQMMERGALLTEFWTGTSPERENFVKRNRIIAGMSETTLVIESSEKGGSLITADLASSYHREVFAVPGRSTDPFSAGCNHLIKTHRASMLTDARDLAYMLNWEPIREYSNRKKEIYSLNAKEKALFEIIQKHGKIQADHLSQKSGLPIKDVLSTLLRLELYGRIRELPGKHFEVS